MSGFPWAASLAVIRRLNPFFLMNMMRRRTARKSAGKGLCPEPRKGRGPWNGVVDPEGGNSVVRQFMRWYRQRLVFMECSCKQLKELFQAANVPMWQT